MTKRTFDVTVSAGACRTCGEKLSAIEWRRTRDIYGSYREETEVIHRDPTRRHLRTGRPECDALDKVIMVVEPSSDPEAPDALWMVASANECPRAYWPVRRQHYRSSSVWRCACPWARSQEDVAAPDRIACRHLKAVAAFENTRLARPVSPPNVSAFVD